VKATKPFPLRSSIGVSAALAGIAAQLCALGLTASAAWLIARASQRPSLTALGLAIVAVRACASIRGVFGYLERLSGHNAALRRIADRRVRLYRALADDPAPGLRDGEALTHMVSDLDATQDLQLRCVLPGVVAAVTGLAAVAVCTALRPLAGAIVAGGVLVAGVVLPLAAALAARRLGGRISAARADLAVRTLDLTDGHDELVVFGARDAAVAAAERAARDLARAERRSVAVSAAADAAGLVVQGLTAIGVALVSAQAGLVLCAVLVLTALAALEAVLPLPAAAQLFVELRPALGRVKSALATSAGETAATVPRTFAVRPVRLPSGHDGVTSRPGRIVLHDVSVRYGDTLALDRVNLTVAPGRSVAVCGESGAGKSTLLAALAGLVRPAEGTALMRPARGLYQDAHVFGTTVRANLLMARPEAGEGELLAVLRQVDLTGWLHALPDGLDTYVGEGGADMSGGERQRLLLARALLADPEVLLLDEPTEALDPDTGRAVLARVLKVRRDRTTVVVTHREDVLDLFDDLIVMARGRIDLVDPAPGERRFGADHLIRGEVAVQPPAPPFPAT
jgi:ATP-binding cassette subfamily C protein CydC